MLKKLVVFTALSSLTLSAQIDDLTTKITSGYVKGAKFTIKETGSIYKNSKLECNYEKVESSTLVDVQDDTYTIHYKISENKDCEEFEDEYIVIKTKDIIKRDIQIFKDMMTEEGELFAYDKDNEKIRMSFNDKDYTISVKDISSNEEVDYVLLKTIYPNEKAPYATDWLEIEESNFISSISDEEYDQEDYLVCDYRKDTTPEDGDVDYGEICE